MFGALVYFSFQSLVDFPPLFGLLLNIQSVIETCLCGLVDLPLQVFVAGYAFLLLTEQISFAPGVQVLHSEISP